MLDQQGLSKSFLVHDICPLWFQGLGRFEDNNGFGIILQADQCLAFLVECICIVRNDLKHDIEGEHSLLVHPDCTQGNALVIECRGIPGNQVQDLIKGFNGPGGIALADQRKPPVKICLGIGMVQFDSPGERTDCLVVLFEIQQGDTFPVPCPGKFRIDLDSPFGSGQGIFIAPQVMKGKGFVKRCISGP